MYPSSSKGMSKIPKRMDGNKKNMKGQNGSFLTKTLSITGSSHSESKNATHKVKGSYMNLKESSLRKHLKAAIKSECNIEPLLNSKSLVKDSRTVNRPLPDPNKVNELDCLNNRNQSRPFPLGKTFLSQIIKTQFKISSKRVPRKTFRERTPNKSKRKNIKPLSDRENESLSHVKAIANCLLENTLNKLDIKESSKLIADHIDDPVVLTPESGTSLSSDVQVLDIPSSSAAQYNEASSDESVETASQDSKVDLARSIVETNNSIASREALYDPNSRVDLLEDFELTPLLEGDESLQDMSMSTPTNDVVFLGMRFLNEDDSAQRNASIFPRWLLRLLRNNIPSDYLRINNEWANFYSQGDGWGNNSSYFIPNNNDENEDASSEASSSSSTAEGTLFQHIISLPDEGRATSSNVNQRTIDYIRLQEECSEEYFDTLENLLVPE